MNAQFVHLHVHTAYSLMDGLMDVDELVEAVAQAQMPACAVTEQSQVFSLVRFYRSAICAGIKPILGAEIWLDAMYESEPISRCVLLCHDLLGYQNLMRLLTLSYEQGQKKDKAVVGREQLAQWNAGLIVLVGLESCMGQAVVANQIDRSEREFSYFFQNFKDRLYISIQRVGHRGEQLFITWALARASRDQVPLVATNNVRFLQRTDQQAHEAKVCVIQGTMLRRAQQNSPYTEQQYLRSPGEMAQLFSDIPESLVNSVELTKRCNVYLPWGETFLPRFPLPDGVVMREFFIEKVKQGLEEKLQGMLSENAQQSNEDRITVYRERLDMELNILNKMDYAGYFLIVADFVRWAKEHDIPVGPGRGSGAGSLVAYSLGITGIDPLQYDLLFERFLNPERISMPDFDIDFCVDGRDRVIDYVSETYGRDHVAQIITYGTMAAKAVVRDVGRVMGYPYGFVDELAKLIPMELGITLRDALRKEERLNERYLLEKEVRDLMDLAMKLEGKPRNVGKHAAGVVIAPSPLVNFTPLYCEPHNPSRLTQFDKDDIEQIGLVKFDFLGLRTLTIIHHTVKMIHARQSTEGNLQPMLDINHISLNDVKVFALLCSQHTSAIFQLESHGITELVRRLKPDCFEDIIALVALYRPGPLQSGMVEDYINRKHGRAEIDCLHSALAELLGPTYGVILYQEQVMKIAQLLAGYSLGQADLLRKAMGKKKPEEMAKHRQLFEESAIKNGVEQTLARRIFDIMEKFAGYGFNKSHSVAYAMLTYQTAWLKTYYPAEFMASVLSSDLDHTDKVVALVRECRAMGLTVELPNIYEGFYRFTVDDRGHIIYGLGAVKGIGESVIKALVKERTEHGLFQDVFDFCYRVGEVFNRRSLEALCCAGAFDVWGQPRALLHEALTQVDAMAEQKRYHDRLGQRNLLAALHGSDASSMVCDQSFYDQCTQQWTPEETLMREKAVLGWYLSDHPMRFYLDELTPLIDTSIAQILQLEVRTATLRLAGYLVRLKRKQTRSGQKIFFGYLEDHTGCVEIMMDDEVYQKARVQWVKDLPVWVEGTLKQNDRSSQGRLWVQQLYGIQQLRLEHAKRLLIYIKNDQNVNDLLPSLKACLASERATSHAVHSKCPVHVIYLDGDANLEVDLYLDSSWQVCLQPDLLQTLVNLVGPEQIRISYSDSDKRV